MDHRSSASTRLARKPGCPEATRGEPAGFSGSLPEPHRADELLRAAQWVGQLQGLRGPLCGSGVGEEGPLTSWELWQLFCILVALPAIKYSNTCVPVDKELLPYVPSAQAPISPAALPCPLTLPRSRDGKH